MSIKEDEKMSLLISSTLDSFGFDQEIISFRFHWFDKVSEAMSSRVMQLLFPFRLIFVGSAGEGFRHLKSDLDILSVITNTVCLDKPILNPHLNILKTDYTNTAPGYTKMVLIQKNSYDIRHPFHLETKYQSSEGHPYLPSAVLGYLVDTSEITGPAISLVFGWESYTSPYIDFVLSIYFIGNEHLSNWARRSRLYTWPSSTVLNEISTMEGYVVPVGDKQSDLQSLEWRICFTTAEKKLVENLNTPVKKLYILLKMVSKTILKPVCKEITSYVVKNVVFWIAEGTPEQQCSVKYLVTYLLKSLYFIKYCLENNHLPNYMIPERNLLRGVSGKEKQSAIDFLSSLLKEGRTIINRIPKMSKCMSYMANSPDRAFRYGRWRDEVEKQTLKVLLQCQRIFNENGQYRFWLGAIRELDFTSALKYIMLVIPEFPDMILQGKFLELPDLYVGRLEATMLL